MADYSTISKDPTLIPGQDYNYLRQTGLNYIEQLSSLLWTDYNIHDPGITILELLCYAITDLSYRAAFNIQDIIAPAPDTTADPHDQAFYTASEILTISPWTTLDYRKLLIDIDGVKNAWLQCKPCPCDDMFLYANCSKSELQYKSTEHTIIIKGFYDALIEFEDDEAAGDLNSGKILYNFSFLTDVANNIFSTATIEMRLLSWKGLEAVKSQYADFRNTKSQVDTVTVKFISGNKTDNVDIPADQFASGLRGPLYATIDVVYYPDASNTATTETLLLEDVPFTVWFQSDADRKALQLADLKNAIQDQSASGIMAKYADKIKKADAVMLSVRQDLQAHRNLCEDFCCVSAVETEDIAICADIDVTPDADIEEVLAQAYYLIDQYFSPDISFYSLQDLLTAGETVDEIFNGPVLNNGFIDNDQLASTQLKTELYGSDIIAILMGIPGVLAVRNLVMSPFDSDGNRLNGEQWTLAVNTNCQPRLYTQGSKFLVFKNGLPFLPDSLELSDTLLVIEGEHMRPKYTVGSNDLPVPQGTYYQLSDYYPLQYSLPLTYGVGYEGLPSTSTPLRLAQAKQLKAYLLFYEQLLVNYLQQLSHVRDLFSLNISVSHSYFSRLLTNSDITGLSDLYVTGTDVLNQATLDGLAENNETFLDRRNRFLDHLMARFEEQFTDYALMLYNYTNSQAVASETLINDKIAFLKDIPFMSSNRGRSFNYKGPACNEDNIAGLKKRIERVLGLRELDNYLEVYEVTDASGKVTERRWRLIDDTGKVYLISNANYLTDTLAEAEIQAETDIAVVAQYITNASNYQIKKSKQWVVQLKDSSNKVLATAPAPFSKNADAATWITDTVAFANDIVDGEKIFIVEHMLLRPRNKPDTTLPDGDPLLPICIGPDCDQCGEEDPYSFRLTIVMNGEKGIANSGIEFRRFAEDTIRTETPAHLGLKICWVSTDQLNQFETLYCDWLSELAKDPPDKMALHNKLVALLNEFIMLKSVYPKATLHDCVDGNDENRVYLNQTII
ncbi:MAG TPA: hypothetical protein VN721_06720 [Flavipsychrobacter sp.]|nr:hypothetical protein [Flavipsychrobacter sp.]